MTGKTHLACGVATGLAVATFTKAPITTGFMTTVCVSAGALLPDIDKMNSKVGRKALPISAAAQLVCGHRGFFHSPIFYLVLGAISLFLFPGYNLYTYAFLLGIGTHLFLDMLNPTGIPLLFPITSRKFHLLSIGTGGIEERIFYFVFILAFCYFFGDNFLSYVMTEGVDGFLGNIFEHLSLAKA